MHSASLQLLRQPSSLDELPSSHCSLPSTLPLPHEGWVPPELGSVGSVPAVTSSPSSAPSLSESASSGLVPRLFTSAPSLRPSSSLSASLGLVSPESTLLLRFLSSCAS